MISESLENGLFDQVQSFARASGVRNVELILVAGEEALTRFANNTIHQNVAERDIQLSVRPQEGQRTARASTNRLDRDSVKRAVDLAIAMMRASEPIESLQPMAPSLPYPEVRRYSPNTVDCSPAQRALRVKEAIAIAEEAGQTAAGIYSTSRSLEIIRNSNGVAARHQQTMAVFSITMMDAGSSGWAKDSAVDATALDTAALARSASSKATLSRNPRELDPANYTVILEPPAVLDLVGQLFAGFSATSLEDKRSFLTDRLGTKLFGENISIADDATHPLQSGAPFDGEGFPRSPLALVERGVPKQVCYSRASAAKAGKRPTGHGLPLPNEIGEFPSNLVIAGGPHSVEDMIRSTDRGILVTRVWYIREVDPYEKIMTGMTRDGTFLVANGEVAGGVRNFRLNQSLVEMLNNVEMLGPAVRASGEETFDMVVPAMKVRDFKFNEVTKF
jgi:predicted Zn-dependent protease